MAGGLEGFACAAAGEFEQARKILEGLLAQPKIETGIAYFVGLVYCLLGEKEQAIHWFEKAYEEKLGIPIILGGGPSLPRSALSRDSRRYCENWTSWNRLLTRECASGYDRASRMRKGLRLLHR